MKKNINIPILISLFFMFIISNLYSQSMSAGAKNSYNKLQEQYLPRLAEKKENIESKKDEVSIRTLNEYKSYLNSAIGVWNRIPRSEMNLKPLKETLTELQTHISYRDEDIKKDSLEVKPKVKIR